MFHVFEVLALLKNLSANNEPFKVYPIKIELRNRDSVSFYLRSTIRLF